jgi:hypothetical protein
MDGTKKMKREMEKKTINCKLVTTISAFCFAFSKRPWKYPRRWQKLYVGKYISE